MDAVPSAQAVARGRAPLSYAEIKALALEKGCRINDLIALSPGNDPFYCGAPAHRRDAEWFAQMWELLKPAHGVHIRRLHYQLISQRTVILGPDGKPYENTDRCWNLISEASKKARYLGLVPIDAFADKRNPPPMNFTQFFVGDTIEVSPGLVPQMQWMLNPPSLELNPPTAMQRYHLEVWCEKSTMNDVLIPLCERHKAVLVTSLGEISVTRLKQLVDRSAKGGRSVRIFYISDFDPAGQSMPVAASRKAEYFIANSGVDIDLKLFSIALTADQCQQYKLPRTPIKESELRRSGFETRHGEGATELDALEALHPGALRKILGSELGRYFDHDLDLKITEMAGTHQAALDAICAQVNEAHGPEIDALLEQHRKFRDARLDLEQRCRTLWNTMEEELQRNKPEAFDWPEADYAPEKPEALFDSARDYEEQLAAYKQFQGR